MQIGDDGALGHLTYCTNIHAGEHWAAVRIINASDEDLRELKLQAELLGEVVTDQNS